MNTMTDADSLFSEPMGLFTIIGLILLLFSGALEQMIREVLASAAPSRPPTLRLGQPRLVALAPAETASASRLLGSIAAEAMAELERWQ
jgi:hypothetical protein